MKKTTLFMILALVLSMAIGLTGTLAYLTDTDEDVNVMTLGNVDIEQIELERIEQSDDNTDDTNLQNFSQGKPLYPAVGTVDWADENQNWPTGGSNQLFTDDLANVVDKFVFVENTGKSDAYVRTIFAYEAGTLSQAEWHEMIHLNINSAYWLWNPADVGSSDDHAVIIDGCKYYLAEAIYLGNAGTDHDVHKDGILAPGETTRPSLLQVFLDSKATNETMEALDGNGNGTYDILVVSQAVQAMGFDDAETALDEAFGEIDADDNPWKENGEDLDDTPVWPITITTADELQNILSDNTDAKSGDVVVNILNDLDASEIDWTPIKVDGYHGAGIITVKGNGNTIKGLSAPLFAGGFAGKSGIVIENLTIADSDVVSANTLGSGAFIESCDSMTTITLKDCHLVDSTVTGGNGSRTGGLLGWTAGYNNVNDGPVKSYITIEDCSVINCDITSNGSVGGIYGHAGNNAWTYSTVKNCTVKDCNLNSTDDGGWRVGVVVGTANVGEMTIDGITESNNTLTQTGKTAPADQSNLYGRFVPGSTGKLTIDGVAITIN